MYRNRYQNGKERARCTWVSVVCYATSTPESKASLSELAARMLEFLWRAIEFKPLAIESARVRTAIDSKGSAARGQPNVRNVLDEMDDGDVISRREAVVMLVAIVKVPQEEVAVLCTREQAIGLEGIELEIPDCVRSDQRHVSAMRGNQSLAGRECVLFDW